MRIAHLSMMALVLCAAEVVAQTESVVNTTLDSTQRAPRVAADASGAAVIAWSGNGPDGLNARREILMQRFDSSGLRLGGEVTVNTTTVGDQELPAVAVNNSGSSIVIA